MLTSRQPKRSETKNSLSPAQQEKQRQRAARMRANGGLGKQPKMSTFSPEAFEKRLKKRSPWYQSIMDPLSGAGARIPDPSGFNTVPYQTIIDGAITAPASGVAGVRCLAMQPAANTSVITAVNTMYGFQHTATDATTSDCGWGSGGTIALTSGQSIPPVAMNQTLGQGLSRMARVVSGGIYLWYEGTLLNTAGDFIAYSNPSQNVTPASSSANSYATLYGATVVPVVQGRAALARWLPLERSALVSRNSTTSAFVTSDYRQFTESNIAFSASTSADTIAREFGIVARGLTSGSVLRYRIVLNVEFIPSQNQSSLLSATPSPIDLVEESFCLSQLSTQDASTSVSSKSAGSTPGVSAVQQAVEKETSGPLGAVVKAAGFVGDIIEVAAPLLKGAAMIL